MRLQTGKIVLKYIENFVRRECEAVNRFRDFLSDVVRQSDMVLLSLCTVSTLYGMVLIASATHFRNTFKYVAIQGFGLLLGVLLYFLLTASVLACRCLALTGGGAAAFIYFQF